MRAFRPQVIVSVWSGTPADGHGHHQYSGVLAREVFDAAADSVRFPASRVHGLQPWTPAKFYRSARRLAADRAAHADVQRRRVRSAARRDLFRDRDREPVAAPLAGTGRAAAARAAIRRRASSRCRASPTRTPPEHGLFDGIDTSWTRFKSLPLADSVRSALDSLAARRARGERDRSISLDPCERCVAPLATYVRLASRAATGVDVRAARSAQRTSRPCAGADGRSRAGARIDARPRHRGAARRRRRHGRSDRAARAHRRATTRCR